MVYFTEAQKKFQKRMRQFARENLSEGASERAKMDHSAPEVLKKLASEGLFGLTTVPEYGGKQTDCVSIGIVFEEVCGVDYSTFSVMLSHVVIPLMLKWASEDFQKEWLPALCAGVNNIVFQNLSDGDLSNKNRGQIFNCGFCLARVE